MDTGFGWILLLVCPIIGGIGLLVWAGFAKRYRLLHYGIFIAGLLVATLSFLLVCANSLALEGKSESIEKVGFLGMIVGSVIACVGIKDRRSG